MAVLGASARLPDSCRHCSLHPTWKPVVIHKGTWQLEAWQLPVLRGAGSALHACTPVHFRNKQQRSQQHCHATPHSCELMPDETGSPRKPPAGGSAAMKACLTIRSACAAIQRTERLDWRACTFTGAPLLSDPQPLACLRRVQRQCCCQVEAGREQLCVPRVPPGCAAPG